MYSLLTALIILVTLCFFMLGGLIVFIALLFLSPSSVPRLHPEMYNPDGTLITDTLYSVNFDQTYDNEDDDYQEA